MIAANGNSVESERLMEPIEQMQENGEISLGDIVDFLGRKGKFLALTTIGLSLIAIFLALVQPKQYQKQLVLSIEPIPMSLDRSLPGLDLSVDRTGSIAVDFLQEQPLEGIAIQSQYDNITQKINLTLRSPNPDRLANATPQILQQLKTDWHSPLEKTLSTNLIVLEGELSRYQGVVDRLEQQISQSVTANRARLEALEFQRASSLAQISALNADREYLEKARENLANFTDKALAIEILQQSAVQLSRSLSRVVIIAVIASFLVALFAAIVRDRLTPDKK